MTERFKVSVLKTEGAKTSVSSNLTASSNKVMNIIFPIYLFSVPLIFLGCWIYRTIQKVNYTDDVSPRTRRIDGSNIFLIVSIAPFWPAVLIIAAAYFLWKLSIILQDKFVELIRKMLKKNNEKKKETT